MPTDFLIEQVHARLGSIIEGFRDDSDPKVTFNSFIHLFYGNIQYLNFKDIEALGCQPNMTHKTRVMALTVINSEASLKCHAATGPMSKIFP